MLTNKPSDNERLGTSSARTGHGAASVIPHLDEGRRQRRSGAEEAPTENVESESEFDTESAPARPGAAPQR